MNTDPFLREGVWCICPDCNQQFRLLYCEYRVTGKNEPRTLVISSCDSGGVYNVEVECPHCHAREDVMAY